MPNQGFHQKLLFHPSSISNYWILNGTVFCNETGAQGTFTVLIDEEGYIWVSWRDQRKDSGDIYVQKIASNGNPLFTANGIPVFNDNNKSDVPRMIQDGQGGVILTWQDNRTGINEVYLQRIDAQGNLNWSSSGIKVANITSLKEDPNIVRNRDGNYVIVWEDNRTGNKDIYVQKLDINGNRLWGDNGKVVCNASGNQGLYSMEQSIIAIGQNDTIITWTDLRFDQGDIYVQRLDSNGESKWNSNGSIICNASFYQGGSIVFDTNNDSFIILWLDDRKNSGYTDLDIYIQRINGNGEMQWDINGINVANASNNQFPYQLFVYNESNIFTAWKDQRIDGAGDIYMQKFNELGDSKWGNNGTKIANITGEERDVTLIISEGSLFVAWNDRASSPRRVSLMKFELNGSEIWTSPITVVNGSQSCYLYKIISDGQGGIILTWADGRDDSNGDLYMLRLNSSGGIWVPPPSNGGSEPPPDIWWIIILVLAITLPVAGVGAAGAVVFIVRRRRQAPTKMPPKKVVARKKLSDDEQDVLKNIVNLMVFMVAIKKG